MSNPVATTNAGMAVPKNFTDLPRVMSAHGKNVRLALKNVRNPYLLTLDFP
jgi:hypothetical protein